MAASLTFVPATMVLGGNWEDWRRVVAEARPTSLAERHVFWTGMGATIGTWAGAIPIPLDWDRPWQQWPLTCVGGCVGGYALACLARVLLAGRRDAADKSS